jgi:hypothetical protein
MGFTTIKQESKGKNSEKLSCKFCYIIQECEKSGREYRSSSLARQPLVGPDFLKKLCPFVPVEGDFLCDVAPGRSGWF